MRKLGAIAVISAGWVILPTLTLVSYFKALYNPPLTFLLPYVPGIFLYFLMLTQVITGSRLRMLDGPSASPLSFVFTSHLPY